MQDLPHFIADFCRLARTTTPATMSNSWVLVTGANRGLGYVTAKKLISDGESVIIGARTQEAGAQCCMAILAHLQSHGIRRPTLQVPVIWKLLVHIL